jgi:hypothetical protein
MFFPNREQGYSPNCSLCPSAPTDHQLLRLASTARKMKEKPCTLSQIVRFPGASHSVYGNVQTGNFHTYIVHNNKARVLCFTKLLIKKTTFFSVPFPFQHYRAFAAKINTANRDDNYPSHYQSSFTHLVGSVTPVAVPLLITTQGPLRERDTW